jgi:hypothetical protein
MIKKHHLSLLLILTFLTSACGGTDAPQPTPSLVHPIHTSPTNERALLSTDALINGFDFASAVDETALTPPAVHVHEHC